ncbi:hypothetical protein NQT69_11830 [Pseudoalteromonas shioyasakiensis]|uniref:hypothetical protein n=1 Tax=Pseudoalteromonas shioyasakiensis TaxID=1190813 RepID=UPI002118DB12|nr:hypothetical protein [Pseudoalteromonas shioyasakiensis]MCQ8878693.1 hypothetical protein [Pseudoalteromonas shioyasakiensis]
MLKFNILYFLIISFNVSAANSESNDSTMVVDVRDKLNLRMQNTAQWLDDLLADDINQNQAHAKGYLRLGWAPRSADFADIETRFKVSLSLPSWENRINLIIDNDADEFSRLPFETNSSLNQEDEKVNAALQFLVERTANVEFENRIGVSRSQLYGRSAVSWKKEFNNTQYAASVGAEYYFSDGFGYFIKLSSDTKFNDFYSVNVSANYREIADELDSEFRSGVYLSYIPDTQRAMVFGVNVHNSFDDFTNYTLSYRYRQQAQYSWLFFEVEPFLEYREELNYRDEVGLAIRLIGYYGQ